MKHPLSSLAAAICHHSEMIHEDKTTTAAQLELSYFNDHVSMAE
jgi:hypothetical protein